MKHISAKSGIVAVSALIIVGVGLWCFMPVNRPYQKVIFLSATNDLQTGTSWGKFRIENKSTNSVSPTSGYFEQRTMFGWAKVEGTYDPCPYNDTLPEAFRSGHTPALVAPGSLTFRTRIPSDAGSYRLVLEVVPCIWVADIGKPIRTDLVYRVGTFLLKFGLLPKKYQHALNSNSRWIETKPFRVSLPNPALQRTQGSLSGSNSQNTVPAPPS